MPEPTEQQTGLNKLASKKAGIVCVGIYAAAQVPLPQNYDNWQETTCYVAHLLLIASGIIMGVIAQFRLDKIEKTNGKTP